MKKSLLALLLTLSLSACAATQPGGILFSIPTPNPGQWVAFGGKEPAITGASWDIPCCDGNVVAGYFYTNLGFAPNAAQSLVLTYTYTANAPVYVQKAASGGNGQTDTNPPTIHLFVWRKGDDLSCAGDKANYRIFGGRTLLVPGANQTITVPFTAFTNCWGQPAANVQDTLNNLLGVGVTFGGQSFAGHGVYLASGSAHFTVLSITVK